MLLVEISFGLLVLLNGIVFFNVFFGPLLKKGKQPQLFPSVSLLIPARNEEKNIAACLQSLSKQDYPELEIIVLNDHSEDQTAALVKDYSSTDKRISLMEGKALPDDWAGKNWACFQLAQKAKNEVFIFTDADTFHAPDAVSKTVYWMHKYGLDFLSAFPQQKTVTFAEKLIVPVIDFFVYSLLPLWFTKWFSSDAIAAANGQWIAFKKEAYFSIGGHESVKKEIVEDVELQKECKRANLKTLTLAGTGTVFCRMYHSPLEVWQGFSKNFYGLSGKKISVFFFFIVFLFLTTLLPYVVLLWKGIPLYISLSLVGLNLWLRLILALRFKHPLLVSVFLHPFTMLAAIIIGLNSFRYFKKGYFVWKGRSIAV